VIYSSKEAAVTRESKLALIIGFVLVLVVGVLVSDHFSQASTMSLDTQEPAIAGVLRPFADPRDREAIDKASSEIPAQSLQDSSRFADNATSSWSSNNVPFEIRSDGQPNPRLTASSSDNSLIERAFNEAQRRIVDMPEALEVLTPPTRHERMLAQTNYSTYTVTSGDTLIGISRRLLNDGERWQELHQINADVLGPDAILKVGMKLKVPDQARSNTTKLLSNKNRSRESVAQDRSYTVVSGDTLGEISMRELGTSKRANEIAELNGLDSVDDIRIGMRLKMPSR
jgi:nucleoid-associated protein YgaU